MIRVALPVLLLLGLPFALSDFWLFIAIEVLAFALYACLLYTSDAADE